MEPLRPPRSKRSDFHYVPASQTDIRRTFARIRHQLVEQERQRQEEHLNTPGGSEVSLEVRR